MTLTQATSLQEERICWDPLWSLAPQTSASKLLTAINDIPCGIIFFLSGQKLLIRKNLPFAIIPCCWLRNYSFAWRPIGFLPSKLPKQRLKGQNACTTHQVLDLILSGVVTPQLKGGIKCSMRDKLSVTSSDLLCYWWCWGPWCSMQKMQQSHQIKWLGSECDCPMEDSDNGLIDSCNYAKAKKSKDFCESNNVFHLQ
jgi:hypothetical protein